jgi:hypothetical protein
VNQASSGAPAQKNGVNDDQDLNSVVNMLMEAVI